MGVMKPDLVMKSIIPVVMAGVLGIYGLIIAVIISSGIVAPGAGAPSPPLAPMASSCADALGWLVRSGLADELSEEAQRGDEAQLEGVMCCEEAAMLDASLEGVARLRGLHIKRLTDGGDVVESLPEEVRVEDPQERFRLAGERRRLSRRARGPRPRRSRGFGPVRLEVILGVRIRVDRRLRGWNLGDARGPGRRPLGTAAG